MSPRGPKWSRQPWGRCPVCGRLVALYNPAGGDGTMFIAYQHKRPASIEMGRPGAQIRCEGSREEVKEGIE